MIISPVYTYKRYRFNAVYTWQFKPPWISSPKAVLAFTRINSLYSDLIVNRFHTTSRLPDHEVVSKALQLNRFKLARLHKDSTSFQSGLSGTYVRVNGAIDRNVYLVTYILLL